MECSGNRVFAGLYGSYGSVLLESQRLPLTRRERLWEPVTGHENAVRAIGRAAGRSGSALSGAV